jgi:transcriptional regulator with XRE-family HTH domain
MNYSMVIREERLQQGLTQSELAHRSGVSLPTVHNMEAGRANPSLLTLTAVLGALGLELKAEPSPADWDQLAVCGAPLMVHEGAVTGEESHAGTRAPVPPTAERLLNSIRDACRELRDRPHGEVIERRREAVQALLLALHMHFPTFFREHLAGIELYEEPLSAPITGRTVRLTREAVAALARYL